VWLIVHWSFISVAVVCNIVEKSWGVADAIISFIGNQGKAGARIWQRSSFLNRISVRLGLTYIEIW
jgi:hypothetical protein